MIRILFISILLIFSACGAASAHVGHLGELAGHTHWIGLGAVAVAGAIVAVLGKKSSAPEDEASDVAQGEEEIEGETEPA